MRKNNNIYDEDILVSNQNAENESKSENEEKEDEKEEQKKNFLDSVATCQPSVGFRTRSNRNMKKIKLESRLNLRGNIKNNF